MLRSILILSFVGLVGCGSDDSSSTGSSNAKLGDIKSSETWNGDTRLDGIVRILPGATITIAPGAKISCTAAAQIQVGGKIKVAAEKDHAKISCSHWVGIIIAQGGSLDANGLELENTDSALEITPNAGVVTFTNGALTNSIRPFTVAESSKLDISKSKISTPEGATGDFNNVVSVVKGSLSAKYLDYTVRSGHEGIMVKTGGEAVIEDSIIKGTGSHDLISSYGAKSVAVHYTTLQGAHCGLHFQQSIDDDSKTPTGAIDVDHVTSEQNSFGITIYATAAAGSFTFKDSNLIGIVNWLDLVGDHGPLNFTNVYVEGPQQPMQPPITDPPAVLQKVTGRIADAKPR